MLNTAAHFPSDTAAKVERALEQLSDINEAAINNDRTVTAATMVNGKGLSSTMGDINLNPASVNTNTGGKINFHYNQASSATSAIYENASGQVRIDGNIYLNGNTTNGFKVKGGSLEAYTHTDTTSNQTRDIIVYGPDGTSRISTLRNKYYTTGNKELEIFVSQDVDGSTVFNSLRMTNDTEGNRRCFLNYSPATTSNSTDVATTAYTRAYTSATYLPLSGGTLTNNIAYKKSSITRGTAPSSVNYYDIAFRDSNSDFVSLYRTEYNTNKSSLTTIKAFNTTITGNNNNIGQIGVGCDSSGNVYTIAPTPATSSNSTQIATTAYVKSNLASYLPLAGGTMTGNLVFNSSNNYDIRLNADDGVLSIFGGSSGNSGSGAKLLLHGTGESTSPGIFILQAGNPDGTYKQLKGKADGTLTWGGNNVATTTTLANYLPLSCSSPITGTIMKDTTHVRGGTDVYAAKDTVPLLVRDANGKNWFRLITSQQYTSSSDFRSSVGFYVYHPTNASQGGNVANIAVGYNQDGPYTSAPTPPTSSNDTNIATTAFVNNRLPYETGTWTPVIAGATTAGAFTYSEQKGYYIKIGKLVFIYAKIVTSDYTTHPEGRFRINGLPFASRNSTYTELVAMGYSGGVSQCIKRIRLAIIPPNTSRIEIEVVNSTNFEEIMYANFSSSSASGLNIQFNSSAKAMNMYVSGCYESAS